MTTIFNENKTSVERSRQAARGTLYFVGGENMVAVPLTFHDGAVTDDALLSVLLDRAELINAKEDKAASRERVTMLKALKSGNDGRGKAKRGPGRPRKDA